ncbi:MAG: hypothetical protein R3284_06780 [Rubricoccaceae bacterium]|nr:hypothetical protein [Rubricoccaceae bacterium]
MLRPIRPDDRDTLHAEFMKLGKTTVRNRFFAHKTDLTPEELKAAPTVLRLGDRALVYTKTVVAQSWGSPATMMEVWIWEENLHNVDKVRMDFIWVIHEAGVWEPDISSIWNTSEFMVSASAGPVWPVATDVDVVVGFVDVDGAVHLMRATTRVQRNE